LKEFRICPTKDVYTICLLDNAVIARNLLGELIQLSTQLKAGIVFIIGMNVLTYLPVKIMPIARE